MTGILADYNLTGHARRLANRLGEQPWVEFWTSFGLAVVMFSDRGLVQETPDDVVWRGCQADGLILLTGNRNHDGPDSLEAVLRAENGPGHLPVFTLADADRILTDKVYLDRVVERLIDRLFDMPNLRGTGRLFLP